MDRKQVPGPVQKWPAALCGGGDLRCVEAVALADRRAGSDLQGSHRGPHRPMTLREQVTQFKATVIQRALTETQGNVTQASHKLGIHRNDVYLLLRALGTTIEEVRARIAGRTRGDT